MSDASATPPFNVLSSVRLRGFGAPLLPVVISAASDDTPIDNSVLESTAKNNPGKVVLPLIWNEQERKTSIDALRTHRDPRKRFIYMDTMESEEMEGSVAAIFYQIGKRLENDRAIILPPKRIYHAIGVLGGDLKQSTGRWREGLQLKREALTQAAEAIAGLQPPAADDRFSPEDAGYVTTYRDFPAIKIDGVPNKFKPIIVSTFSETIGQHLTPEAMAGLDIPLPKRAIPLGLFWNLNRKPPLEFLRPQGEGGEKLLFMGAFSTSKGGDVPRAVFLLLGAKPKLDRVAICNYPQVLTLTANALKFMSDPNFSAQSQAYEQVLKTLNEGAARLEQHQPALVSARPS